MDILHYLFSGLMVCLLVFCCLLLWLLYRFTIVLEMIDEDLVFLKQKMSIISNHFEKLTELYDDGDKSGGHGFNPSKEKK